MPRHPPPVRHMPSGSVGVGVAPGTVRGMAERVEDWWARRRFSRGREVPYEIGEYREAWASYPQLIRQYHPDLNAGITLTQIPPAADVLLLWECVAGHRFAATPTEQRMRPGRERRKSAWCPDCTATARPAPMRWPGEVLGGLERGGPAPGAVHDAGTAGGEAGAGKAGGASVAGEASGARGAAGSGGAGGASDAGGAASMGGTGVRAAPARAPRPKKPAPALCAKTPPLPVGEPFVSVCAPKPASAVEGRLRADVFGALGVTPGLNAVRTGQPFFRHLEVWPDILLPELRVAIEYDSTGRFGLEHVGTRTETDRKKDRMLRRAGWEVIRLRTGKLEKLGPYDLQLASWNRAAMGKLLDVLREVRGPLFVDAYLR